MSAFTILVSWVEADAEKATMAVPAEVNPTENAAIAVMFVEFITAKKAVIVVVAAWIDPAPAAMWELEIMPCGKTKEMDAKEASNVTAPFTNVKVLIAVLAEPS